MEMETFSFFSENLLCFLGPENDGMLGITFLNDTIFYYGKFSNSKAF